MMSLNVCQLVPLQRNLQISQGRHFAHRARKAKERANNRTRSDTGVLLRGKDQRVRRAWHRVTCVGDGSSSGGEAESRNNQEKATEYGAAGGASGSLALDVGGVAELSEGRAISRDTSVVMDSASQRRNSEVLFNI